MKANTVKKYLRPSRIKGRWTTFDGSLQAALAVHDEYDEYDEYDEARHAEALAVLEQSGASDLRCVYCGAEAATWDHLENNVKDGRFSGFGHRIYNLVPACRSCNEKKGSKPWRLYLDETNPLDKSARAAALARFAERNDAERFGWSEIQRDFPELAANYDKLLDEIKKQLKKADEVASKIREAIAARKIATPVPMKAR
jgi:hypothetical protein